MTIDLNDLRFELDRFAAGYSGTDPTILRAAKEYLRIVESAPDVQAHLCRNCAEVEKLTKVRDDLMVAIGEALFVMDGLGRDTLRAALDAAKES